MCWEWGGGGGGGRAGGGRGGYGKFILEKNLIREEYVSCLHCPGRHMLVHAELKMVA